MTLSTWRERWRERKRDGERYVVSIMGIMEEMLWGVREGGGEQASDMRIGRKIVGLEMSKTCLGVKLRWMERDVRRIDRSCRSSC